MSTVLFISTIVLCAAGVLCSFVYLIMNLFSKAADLENRSAVLQKMLKSSILLSLLLALLSCLLADPANVKTAIDRTSGLYGIIAITCLIVAAESGLAELIAVIAKSRFGTDRSGAVGKLFGIAVFGAVVGMILSWLLS